MALDPVENPEQGGSSYGRTPQAAGPPQPNPTTTVPPPQGAQGAHLEVDVSISIMEIVLYDFLTKL